MNDIMAGTYSAVKNRQALIPKTCKEELHKYITALVQNRKSKMLAVNCMPDHAHVFVGFHPSILISDLVKEIKVESTEFINTKNWCSKFQWQQGYGVFSYSKSAIHNVCEYIYDQENHHKLKSFRDEYLDLLKKREIEFNEQYLFDWILKRLLPTGGSFGALEHFALFINTDRKLLRSP